MASELVLTAEALVSKTKSLKEELKGVFQNSELDFNYRWQHYLAWYNLGGAVPNYVWYGWNEIIPEHAYPIGYDCIVHVDRHQTVDLVDSLQNIVESLVCDESTEFYKEYCLLEEEGIEDIYSILDNHKVIVALKEQLMAAGISSVYHDW